MNSISSPLVSVITPLHNAEDYIEETMQSVAAQSMPDYEHIVVDDGSTDAGPQIVSDYAASDARISLLKNIFAEGPAGARNTAISKSRGKYIAFIDSDDIWYPTKLAQQLDAFKSADAPLIFSSYDLIDECGQPLGKMRVAPPSLNYGQLARRNIIGCLTVMIDRAQVTSLSMPDIRMRQDWGLWLKVLRETNKHALGIREPLAALRLHKNSLSNNKWRATYYNFVILRRFENFSILRASFCVCCHSLGALRER